MSCSVLLSAWPICRLPVTFGGGMTTQNGLASPPAARPARKAPVTPQSAEARPSAAAKSNDLSIMKFWSATQSETLLRSGSGLPSGADGYGRRRRKRHGRYKCVAAVEVNVAIRAESLLPPARHPLNLLPDQPFDHRRQVVVQPLLD